MNNGKGIIFAYKKGALGKRSKIFVDRVSDGVEFMVDLKFHDEDGEYKGTLRRLEKETKSGKLYLWTLGTAFRLDY